MSTRSSIKYDRPDEGPGYHLFEDCFDVMTNGETADVELELFGVDAQISTAGYVHVVLPRKMARDIGLLTEKATIPADVGRRAMEALTNVCRNFPTDFDMADLGWDSLTVEAACTAYDKARASITELQQALAAPSGGQRE